MTLFHFDSARDQLAFIGVMLVSAIAVSIWERLQKRREKQP